MSSDESRALVRYLLGASRAGLGEFQLLKHNKAANLERGVREQLHSLVEELAWAYLSALLREHGETIVAELAPHRRSRANRG